MQERSDEARFLRERLTVMTQGTDHFRVVGSCANDREVVLPSPRIGT
jgi:hypothetical protein